MAPVDSGPIVHHGKEWDTHPLGWKKAVYLAVKSRFIYLTGWTGNFWVEPKMPVEKLAEVLVCDVDRELAVPEYWRRRVGQ